jgi:membrane-associated phospholipid phosphatase
MTSSATPSLPRRPHRAPPATGVGLEVADVLVLATLTLFTALSLVFRVDRWALRSLEDVVAGGVFFLAVLATRRVHSGWGRFLARTGALSLAYAYLFGAVDRLQLIIQGHWMDDSVMTLQAAVLGAQPTLWLERFVRPWLTEWMMFAYVSYIALYPLVCGAVFLRHGDQALEECLLALGLANVTCDLGFIAFPVAGPTAYIGAAYTVPLHGYMFTALGEFIRTHLHYVGGSLPSPHAAAATVLWMMAWKYRRFLFWLLTPLVLTLDVATFYCRYHYLADTIAGIATAAVALLAAPPLQRWWHARLVAAGG